MKNKIIYIAIVVAIAAVTGALLIGRSNRNPAPTAANNASQNGAEQFSGFSLKDYSGNTVTSAEFKGKPLVINSWASWCPFCRQEIPDFVSAQEEFGNKVAIIAVDRAESLQVAKGYTDQQGTTGKLMFIIDPTDSFYQSIGGFSMPETIFVDKNGNIVDHKRGPMDINEMRERINKLLAS